MTRPAVPPAASAATSIPLPADQPGSALPPASALHDPDDIDLRPQIITLLPLVLALAALTRLPVALAAFAGAAMLAAFAGLRLRETLHRLAHVEGFLLLLLLFLPFTMPGRPLLHLGPLTASAEGLARAGLIAAKVGAIALLLAALLGRIPPERLGRSLAALGVPQRFLRLMEAILRHSHSARAGLSRQSEAMRARAFRTAPPGPRQMLHHWHSYGHLLGGALLRGLDRAERVEEAMRLRGGGVPSEPLPPLRGRALLGSLLAACIAAGLLIADRLA